MSRFEGIASGLRAHRQSEEGAITAMGLFGFIFAAMVGAIALDVTHLMQKRTLLQTAADQAAHAAIYQRDNGFSEAVAKQDALALVSPLIPAQIFGDAITANDIEFGTYDTATSTFTPLAGETEAVRVTTRLTEARGNAAASFLFRMVGIAGFDVATQSTYLAYEPGCLNEGFVADQIVDMQSGNVFKSGFCIHANDHVELNSGNRYEDGVIISMPDKRDVVAPASGEDQNDGFAEALRDGHRDLRILDRLDTIRTALLTPGSEHSPDYVAVAPPIDITTRRIRDGDLSPGQTYNVRCQGQTLTIAPSAPLSNVVIVTDCEVKFGQGTELNDVVILTTSTSEDSFNSPEGLIVGQRDNCAPGGGAQLLTYGGMNFPSNLEANGAQFVAKGDISFTANANGIKGVSMVSGGDISGTSNMNMGACGTGMEDNFRLNYYRLVG